MYLLAPMLPYGVLRRRRDGDAGGVETSTDHVASSYSTDSPVCTSCPLCVIESKSGRGERSD